MKALIFAAGLGTRLKPLTDTMPKALVQINGKTLLERAVEKLKSSGYDDIVVNIHHFGEQIIDFLKEKGNFGVKISISDERDLLRETGGGVRHASPLLSDAPGERFLVHNVDIISNLDLKWFDREYEEAGSPFAAILVSERETSRYFLFDDDSCLVGWTNVSTGEVRSPYPDIDTDHCHKLAFSGIHIMSTQVLEEMKEWPEAFPIVDFYLTVCKRRKIKGIVMPGLEMHDVGKAADLSSIRESL